MEQIRESCVQELVLISWSSAGSEDKDMDVVCEANEPLLTEILKEVPDVVPAVAQLTDCIMKFDTLHSHVFSNAKNKSKVRTWSKFEAEKLHRCLSYIRKCVRKYGVTKTRTLCEAN